MSGGEGEIRTHGTRKGSTVFETAAFDHSATSPRWKELQNFSITSPAPDGNAGRECGAASPYLAILKRYVLENFRPSRLRQSQFPHAHDRGSFASADHVARGKWRGQIHPAPLHFLCAARRFRS